MKKTTIFMLLLCCNCGGLDKIKKQSSTSNRQTCLITLGFNQTKVVSKYDLPRYEANGYSDSCKEYLGENIQTLRFRLNVHAKESVGIVEMVSIDGRRMDLTSYSLTNSNVVIDDIDTSKVDNGPLQMQSIWASFAFPKDTEKSLYPSRVELMITSRN